MENKKNTTLSEKIYIQIEKSQKEAELPPLRHKYTSALSWLGISNTTEFVSEIGTVYPAPALVFTHGFLWVHVAHLIGFSVLCCFDLFVFILLLLNNVPMSLDCLFFIVSSTFFNVYLMMMYVLLNLYHQNFPLICHLGTGHYLSPVGRQKGRGCGVMKKLEIDRGGSLLSG